MEGRWRFWIDRGGTFTDCIGRDPDGGRLRVVKVLSSDEAPLIGIRAILGLEDGEPIPPCEVRMGTTLATNALLERRGAPCALLITEGFEDLPEIGDQTRPALFALNVDKPAPLAAHVLGVTARATPDGDVRAEPDLEALRPRLRSLAARGVRSAAVAVLHGPRSPSLERALGAAVAEAGIGHASLSHEVDAEQGLLARADTTVADAYLTPLLTDYVAGLRRELPGSDLSIMQSSGALADADRFRGRNAVLSGPAGGVVALGWIAERAGLDRVIGFDMGGTSTDVCRWDGAPDRVFETQVAGVRLRAPMMSIHTVAAGGGSICRFDGRRMTVGPTSAGADPGPLCYGRPEAAEPTLTDVNLALGRLSPARFPFPLDEEAPRAALEAIAARVGDRGWAEVAAGFFRIAVESMAEAIRRVTVARGHDARDYALVVFGGAGGQHACAVARRLGVRRVLCHPLAGVLSALGMGVADVGWHAEADVGGVPLEAGTLAGLAPTFARLEAQGRAVLGDAARTRRRLDLRYAGTETGITLDLSPGDDDGAVAARFAERHRAEFGYDRPAHPVVATTARLELTRGSEPPAFDVLEAGDAAPRPDERTRAWMDGAFHDDVPVYGRERLGAGAELAGPALVLEDTGALVVEPGWTLTVGDDGGMELTDEGGPPRAAPSLEADPVRLEIFANAFMSIAEQMGAVLQRTAVSTNIRERLDFSCAVFDAGGALVANAPHIPVHLGAMGETVKAVHAAHPDPSPGDVFVSNDPSAGGSHLPDVTVVSPVHDDDGTLRFFVASRGHHADVGGITPGSMPPFSRRLDEEGVIFRHAKVVHGGRFDRDGVLATLEGGAYPARRPRENLADLEAQIAANRKGATLLAELCRRHGAQGVEVVSAYMGHVQADAAAKVAEAIAALPDGERTFEDALDDGATIRVRVTVDGDRMDVDFAGTAPELAEANLNAPRAVTVAALLYVLRSLVGAPIPLNAGCLRPVSLAIPGGSLLDPSPGRAVAGGNVETSQRVVDVLLGALRAAAASQGTMNNVTFGDDRFGYYETLAGGAGAGPGFDGASCVHTHMTNSRITDPEVLEDRFPVRLVRFARRRGSGGDGRWRGGDGLVREIEALAPLSFSILSERRVRAPFGLEGGEDGARGINRHVPAQGSPRELPGRVVIEAAPGDRIAIETPGGGGWGEPDEDRD
ncbi:MAG TPA: hydantoinase B/oxoprolinase family protein [Sandaracinaceae bacterium LLY-WYZ-13_1]|nr:hydantoinase B/oxoprolinase family protein [Sandaracinaceae bacterium LLY-WYZ-13_1]